MKGMDIAMQVELWNRAVPVGSEVEYREILTDEPTRYKVRTQAQLLGGHTAVIWLEGKSGCVGLSHCTPVKKGGA